MIKVTKTEFEGLLVIEPKVFDDNRGYFFESYNKKVFKEAGIEIDFVQDNQSFSKKGVLRGLHFQRPPFAQTKLVRVLSGLIQDVVVDLRKNQPTFSKHFSIELSAENKKQLLVPKGFAHGFLVLSDTAEVLYKCDEYYNRLSEGGINFLDVWIGVISTFPIRDFSLSEKDKQLSDLKDTNVDF
ncbi:MAG: dTDP-4-dehydrorhamnose 3,5-epimerase [Cyclobacteriaceae bacterium]|nr:dTDP-4-dehydrorhamnose 3,5-epimerase [Cyclobacteriaceae bacterium]